MTRHSIILAHRHIHAGPIDRNGWLLQCVHSILASAEATKQWDFEIVVVDSGGELPPSVIWRCRHVTYLRAPRHDEKTFNKGRLLNLGIHIARGEILTFLDGDSTVGKLWMEGIMPQELDRLCYRVRYAHCMGWDRWDKLPLAYEAYGDPEHDCRHHANSPILDPYKMAKLSAGAQPWGNSQFSIWRKSLGNLRFPEHLEGRGWEDIWMLRQIANLRGPGYRAEIRTDAEHAILQPRHETREPDWGIVGSEERNRRIYRKHFGIKA